jgi:hypothetical protein
LPSDKHHSDRLKEDSDMPVQCYDIFFSGKTVEGADPTEVKQELARIFNTRSEQLEYLFSGSSVKVKSGVDQETAIKYRVAFRNAGALVEIQSADSVADTPRQAAAAAPPVERQSEAKMTLLPPRSGSLIDCAPAVTPAPLPDISALSLASPGAVLDETPPPPPRGIDTSGLELAPANTGTLEECQIKREAAELPDISRLAIVEDDDLPPNPSRPET